MCDLETGVEVGREKEGSTFMGAARSLSPGGEGRVGEVKPSRRTGARALGLQNKGLGFYPEAMDMVELPGCQVTRPHVCPAELPLDAVLPGGN